MATIQNSTAGALATASNVKTNTSASRIADNFDQFMQLLTTQLRNQSPLDPLDTNQFTQQLVQFAGVEQQLKTNDTLASLLTANKTNTITNAMGFVGTRVVADGTTTSLRNGSANWNINAPRNGTATITVKDASGNQVYTGRQTLTAGEQSFQWNGRNSNGQLMAEGDYTIVVAAQDGAGQVMTVKSEISGIVDSVDVSGSSPVLRIGGITLPIERVKSIHRGT